MDKLNEKQKWLNTAKSQKKGKGRALSVWAYAMVKAANIPEESRSVALIEAIEEIRKGGLRGDISTRWEKIGFTNQQFNFELFT